ncbi:hypothetical protein EVJ58_g8842 [Rhodofomes roseus]|uniref:Uncharacterized protein n=1 Tax=Rhodofomes roseus TaxID=34475 RepID=A0A4Y9XXT8_9APHY|nr:hypothetical protein EVJ58_g8842 [Rhodofomes roseus]
MAETREFDFPILLAAPVGKHRYLVYSSYEFLASKCAYVSNLVDSVAYDRGQYKSNSVERNASNSKNEEHHKALIGDPGKQGDRHSGSKSGKTNVDLRYEVVFAIFSKSPDTTLHAKWASSHLEKGKWARIIEGCLNDLRKKYREVLKELSGTGFGLPPEDCARGVATVSDKALQDSKLQQIWFDCLTLLYRDKPSVTVTAGTFMPGQDLVGQAYTVLVPTSPTHNRPSPLVFNSFLLALSDASSDRALAHPGLGGFNNMMQGVMENLTTTQQVLNDIRLEQAHQKTINKEMVLVAH